MVRFFTTQLLRESIDKYLKKDEYSNCKEDLCNFFKNRDISTISSQPSLIVVQNKFHFIKSRIENSCTNKGKSSGYRLYYYVDTELQYVYFIGFYPKTGKYGQEDLTDTELKILIKSFSAEKASGKLVEHNINDNLSLIKVHKQEPLKK